jgi:glycosyltransferase involved in cell wall biosynthesis
MARGVPVIVTDMGGSPELVADGGGLRVPPDDPVALRAAIDQLDDDSTCRRLGAEGIGIVRSRYAPDVHVRAIEDLYCEVLGSGFAAATTMEIDDVGSIDDVESKVS